MLITALKNAILLLVIILTQQVSAQLLNFRNYNLEQGLPATGVYDFCLAPDGKLWMATEGGGVAIFDGEQFEVITTDQGLCSNHIRALITDSLGRIWIGSQNNGISVFHGKIKNYDTNQGLISNAIRALAGGLNGDVWIATTAGVQVFRNGALADAGFNNELPDRNIRTMTFAGNILWIGTDLGLAAYDGKSLTIYDERKQLPNKSIVHLAPSADGGVWVGTTEGAAKILNGSVFRYSALEQLPHPRVRAICQDLEGALWLGTYNGVLRFSGDDFSQMEYITTDQGLADNRIRSIFMDPAGSLWFATFMGGAGQLLYRAFVHYTPDEARKFAFTAVAETGGGNSIAGVFENGLLQLSEGKMNWIDRSSYTIKSLAAADSGVVWMTTDRGLAWYQNEQVNWIPTDTLGISFMNHSMVLRGNFLFSAQNRIFKRSVNPKIQQELIQVAQFDSPDVIIDFGYDSDSVLWAITETELAYCRPAKGNRKFIEFQSARMVDCQYSNLAFDSFGNVWVATLNRGVFKIGGGNVKNLDDSKGLASNRVHQVVFDRDENLWVGGLKGIDKVVLTAGNEVVEKVIHYSNLDGLRSMQTFPRAAYLDSEGKIWFGTVNGLTCYNPESEWNVRSEPVTRITGISLFFDEAFNWNPYSEGIDSITELPINLRLPYNKNHLTFRFQGVSLSNPASVRYQYKLEGFDEWSPITHLRQATYANLPPGQYTFLVSARSESGLWTPNPQQFSFVILQPYYYTWWFILSALGILVLLVWLFIWLRERRYVNERLYLEEVVDERTSALKDEMKKSDELLLNILPANTARELKEKGTAAARQYQNVTVLFSDFKGFTRLAESLSSSELVATLDECFRAFDEITEFYGLEKIKTIGDAYMCASGLPEYHAQHAQKAVLCALQMMQFIDAFNRRRRVAGKPEWPLRIGIHSGPVVSGIVGKRKFSYDIWGDAVNTAARMESAGQAGKINISQNTQQLIDEHFVTESRGLIHAKNKGKLEMFFVLGLRAGFKVEKGVVVHKEPEDDGVSDA
jgi:ligand-binding sensor domain-containing protein/class 3 adenylate cyclase